MRILVMQLTRMGDMVQTSPLIRSLRRKHPKARISVMIRPMAKGIALSNKDIDEVFVYDDDEIIASLHANDSDWFLEAYTRGDAIISWMRDGGFDVAYNCTHSIASAMLLKIAQIPRVVGAHLSDDWSFLVRGAWPNYMFSSVSQRACNDLNLCDVTGRFAEDAPASRELVHHVSTEDRSFIEGLLKRHGIVPGDFVVCMQLGASDEKKRWAEGHFAALAKGLVEERQAKVLLVGVESEAPFGDAFERHAPGLAIPLFGKTSLAQAAALLERAQLLVTNDTGTMHIAAAVGCPILLVSIGYVHFRETGPYAAGHLAIEERREVVQNIGSHAARPSDREAVTPEQVGLAADWLLADRAGETPPRLEADGVMEGIDVYRSDFAPDGCLEWYPLIRRALEEPDFLRMAYRMMWLDHLKAYPAADVEDESLRRLLAGYAGCEAGALDDWSARYDAGFGELMALAQQGVEGTQRLLDHLDAKGPMKDAQRLVDTLMALDEAMRIFGEVNRACRPLVQIARFERDNLEAADPVKLGQITLQIYATCRTHAALMREKIARIAEICRETSG